MEERYEIRGKIGQGGLGVIYRAYDTKMSREVAIKRIPPITTDPEHEQESTRQLLIEAGALARLQHPHIVTIFDVGADEDGPYVVMELITGRTLDESIENAPLTWQDFRELAMQTQEALIAAQELDLIHSDLKPANLMLTWLPSGKFQVKIVDFGLATLTQSQSKEELEALEAVYGSIFFMAPEQFERVPLDMRTDIYSIGCVYYQALAGVYPFNGETAAEVMTSHLHHQVKPLQEVRADIPLWACDWVMWLLNRMPADRPDSSRNALSVFIQNDKIANPPLSRGTPAQNDKPVGNRPQAIHIPRPGVAGPRSQPNQSALPTPPIIAAASQQGGSKVATKTAPQALLPPEGSKPSVHTSPHAIPEPEPQQAAAPAQIAKRVPPVAASTILPSAGKKSKAAKKSSTKIIAAVAGLALAVGGGFFAFQASRKGGGSKAYQDLVAQIASESAPNSPVTSDQLAMLLEGTLGKDAENPALYKALALVKTTAGSDADALILNFAVKHAELSVAARELLIRDVIQTRKSPQAVGPLLEITNSTSEPRIATAAMLALRTTATDEFFAQILQISQTQANDTVLKAAEDVLSEVIRKSTNRTKLSGNLNTAYVNAPDIKSRQILLRLLARCGGEQAMMLVKDSLNGTDRTGKMAAISALGNWGDAGAFPLLLEFAAANTDAALGQLAFEAAFHFVSEPTSIRQPDVTEELWTKLLPTAKAPPQQKTLIDGLAQLGSETWAYRLIDKIAKDPQSDPSVVQHAESILAKLRSKN